MFSLVSRTAARLYYRLTTSGPPVPARGPALLVANHPNSLLDPMLVVATAGRPIRFLAKAPLFADPKLGWLMRASGAIPVHRARDNPDRMQENQRVFAAVTAHLGEGAAVGIFPEGISHSGPALAPLRTGAARIALGTAMEIGTAFPIVPVGLVHRDKGRFRSEAHVVLGTPIAWDDLARTSPDNREAVRTLTDRIDAGLRAVTVNLTSWEDRPLVECVEQIWAAEYRSDGNTLPEAQIARTRIITDVLAAVRDRGGDSTDLIRRLRQHARRLGAIGLSPDRLRHQPTMASTIRWISGRLYLIGVPAVMIGTAGRVVFAVPFFLTDRLARLGRPDPDQVSTHKLLYGLPVYALWLVLITTGAGFAWGWPMAVAALAGAPVLGIVGLWVRERWQQAWDDVRSFVTMRRRRDTVRSLREDQRALAGELRIRYDHHVATDRDPT